MESNSVIACPTVSPTDFIDDYALERIDYRVRQLTLQFDLSEHDQEDVRNDMVVELLEAMERFKPAKSKRETFINRVLDRFVLYIMRQLCTSKRRSHESPLGFDDVSIGFQPCGNDPREGELSEQGVHDRRLDIATIISKMSEREQHIARLLMIHSRDEVASILGVHRCTMSYFIARMRWHFKKTTIKF